MEETKSEVKTAGKDTKHRASRGRLKGVETGQNGKVDCVSAKGDDVRMPILSKLRQNWKAMSIRAPMLSFGGKLEITIWNCEEKNL